MTLQIVADWLGAVLLFAGVFFTLVGAIGQIRFQDIYSRMHAASKPQFLGLMFVLAGIGLESWQWRWIVLIIVVLVLQFLTAPVASHLVARAAYRTGVAEPRPEEGIAGADLLVDELTEDLQSSSLGDAS